MCFTVGSPITESENFPALRLVLYFFLDITIKTSKQELLSGFSNYWPSHRRENPHMSRGEQTEACMCGVCLFICDNQNSELPHLLQHGVGPYSNVSNIQVREFSLYLCTHRKYTHIVHALKTSHIISCVITIKLEARIKVNYN